MKCFDENAALDLALGRAEVAARGAIEEHLDGCDACRRLVSIAARAALRDGDGAETSLLSSAASPRDEDADEAHGLGSGAKIDHFQILRRIGRGGMGEVYLARDTRLGRKVALKLIRRSLLGSQEIAARFQREAETTARFSHPNIVTIHAVGEHHGAPYVALEHVTGQSLRERLGSSAASGGSLGLMPSLRIALAIGEALEEAHRHGVLHRDLKPGNVLIADDGRVRLVDFGLATFLRAEDAEPAIADRGASIERRALAGTPLYMAPEQWRGGACSEATDVWGLAVMIYEMIAGRLPFRGGSLAEQRGLVCSGAPPQSQDALSFAPPELVELLTRSLVDDPKQRPTVAAMTTCLRELLLGPRPRREAEESPFRGLLPFRERHADLFFGREAELTDLLERLLTQPVVPIAGPSGVGKSSFVHAGVVPHLRSEGWTVVSLRPGRRPFEALSRALDDAARDDEEEGYARGDRAEALAQLEGKLSLDLVALSEARRGRVLLFVDQMEEVFNLDDQSVARRFVAAVCAAADDAIDPVRVVLTVREDFLGRLAAVPEARASLRHLMVLHSPEQGALRRILRLPVERVGYRYEDDAVVDAMIAEVSERDASLAMLEFTAQALWQRRDEDRRALLRAEYDRLGGVVGALAKHADGLLASLDDAERSAARTLLLRMVKVSAGAAKTDITRALVTRRAVTLGLGERGERVLARLIEARLVSVTRSSEREPAADAPASPSDRDEQPDATLELIHDALLVTWGALRRWIVESQGQLALIAEAAHAAAVWDRRGRRPEATWSGDDLRDALRALDRSAADLAPLVRDFLEASRATERRRKRRVRSLVTTALLVLFAAATVFAVQKNVADEQRAEAERQRGEAEAQRSIALREGAAGALDRGVLLEARSKLRMAFEGEDSTLARALWWRIARDPRIWVRSLDAVPHMIAFSPDGRTLAAASQDMRIHLLDVASSASRAWEGHHDQVLSVAFASDGSRVASGGWDGSVLLRGAGGGVIRALDTEGARMVRSVVFTPDGQTLAAGGHDGKVRLWDLSDPDRVTVLGGQSSDITSLATSPDGRTLASASLDQTVLVRAIGSGRVLHKLVGHTAGVRALRFSPDGRTLVSAGHDRDVRLWDPTSGRLLSVLTGHTSTVFAVAISPDGKTLASAGADRDIRLWDLASRTVRATLRGHTADVYSLHFSPDGTQLASASSDRSVRLWQMPRRDEAPPERYHTASITALAFSPDGSTLATASGDRTVILWETRSGVARRVLAGHEGRVRGVVFSNDGAQVITTGDDETIRFWSRDEGEPLRILSGHRGGVTSLSASPDGRLLATGGVDRAVRLWDVATGAPLRALSGHEARAANVRFSPDSARLVSSSNDRTARVWDVASGHLLRTLSGHEQTVRDASFAPDGERLGTVSDDGAVRLWGPSGAASQVIGEGAGRAYAIAFHPGGEHLVTAHADTTARIWDLGSDRSVVLRGHRAEVNSVAVSPDGSFVATVSDDQTVRLWSLPEGQAYWRAPVMTRSPPRVFTHGGWQSFEDAPLGSRGTRRTAWEDALEEGGRLGAESRDGQRLCLQREDGALMMWSLREDRLLFQQAAQPAEHIEPWGNDCVVLANGEALRFSSSGAEPLSEGNGAKAIAVMGDALLLANASEVLRLDRAGVVTERRPCGANASALVETHDGVLVGYANGAVERIAQSPDAVSRARGFNGMPSSPVLRLVEGPSRTVAVGFADGTVGLWDERSGTQLLRARLHGSLVHLMIEGTTLYAASDLGRHMRWDLSVLTTPYCELLEQIWKAVPVVWEDGLGVARGPAQGHACRGLAATVPPRF